MSSDTDFGINRNKSDWFRMNINPKFYVGPAATGHGGHFKMVSGTGRWIIKA